MMRTRFAGGTWVVLMVLFLALVTAWGAAAQTTTYRMGTAVPLLDSNFYAGGDNNGSGTTSGRMAFFSSASGDGQTVAFWAVNTGTFQSAVFLVTFGDPSSWRRLTPDMPNAPDAPIDWSPDDLFVIVGPYSIEVATATMNDSLVYDYRLNDTSSTRLPSQNWFITYTSSPGTDELVAIPVETNGAADPLRTPVVLTNWGAAGVSADWPAISKDGDMVAFADYHGSPDDVQPDTGDVYILKNVPGIIDGSVSPPTSLADPNVIAIRSSESANFAHVPQFSEDKTLMFFTEDWNNVFRDGDFFATLFAGNFDIMISNADGTGADVRFDEPGNQFLSGASPGGTRLLFNKDVGGVIKLFVATLEVATEVGGIVEGDPGDNDIVTDVEQEAEDASGTTVTIPADTHIDFPVGVDREIQIFTPIDPATEAQLPVTVDAIPVIRQFGPAGTQFNPPVTITITYTDSEVAGMNEAGLRVFLFNEVSGIYDIEVTTGLVRDLVNNTITFPVSHFSKFGLAGGLDTDGDGIADVTDPDDDNDGVLDVADPMPLDTDDDGLDNVADPDDDADGLADGDDPYSLDTDNDGLNNAADTDDDGDGILDSGDTFLFDTDNDGLPNATDPDDDDDGISDFLETSADADLDTIPNLIDLDSDNDTIPDIVETGADADSDGLINSVDTDSDNDGVPDYREILNGTDPYDILNLDQALPVGAASLALALLAAGVWAVRRRTR